MQQFYIQVLEFKTQTRESSETLTFLFLEIGTSQVAVNCRNGNQQTMILVANNVTTSTPPPLSSLLDQPNPTTWERYFNLTLEAEIWHTS